ncbi:MULTISPECIES: hypothetical protein [Streptomyces]|uniref:Transposase n=1 Tax=Streptomyces aureus TaxID=193461 RepID=A0ABV4SV93_9ACTN
MGRKVQVPFAHIYGVGVLLCRATGMEAFACASHTLRKAYIDWPA